MEWILQGAVPAKTVPVPDHLLETLLDELRRPPAQLDLDPYRDRLLRDEIGVVVARLLQWRDERLEALRRELMDRMRLSTWRNWADPALQAAVAGDDQIALAWQLVSLCEDAQQHGVPVLVAGD